MFTMLNSYTIQVKEFANFTSDPHQYSYHNVSMYSEEGDDSVDVIASAITMNVSGYHFLHLNISLSVKEKQRKQEIPNKQYLFDKNTTHKHSLQRV